MKELIQAINNIYTGFKNRPRVSASFKGDEIVIYANDQVLVVQKDGLQAKLEGVNLHLTTHDGELNRAARNEYRILKSEKVVVLKTPEEAIKTMRKVFKATSPIYVRIARFSAYVLGIGYVIVLLGQDPNAANVAQANSNAYAQQQYAQQAPQAPTSAPVAAAGANDVALSAAPFQD